MIATTGQLLYLRVADAIRSQIASGHLAVDEKIPSTAELSGQHKVSIGAVRTAVKLLQNEGILIGQPGKGVYVRATPETAAEEAAALKSTDEQIAGLREEVARLANQGPSEIIVRIEELQAEVGRLQADLRHLYDRLGQPYPRSRMDSQPKRRKSSA